MSLSPAVFVCKGPQRSACLILRAKTGESAAWHAANGEIKKNEPSARQPKMRTSLFCPPDLIGIRRERISPESAGDEDGYERKLLLGFLARARRGCLCTDLKSNYELWGAFFFLSPEWVMGDEGRADVCVSLFSLFYRYINTPLANRGACDSSHCLHTRLCIRLPLTRCTSRPPTDPIVASLASVERAGTLKECKAADQSGLERECTQRPPCEGFLSLSFFLFFLQQSPLLAALPRSPAPSKPR